MWCFRDWSSGGPAWRNSLLCSQPTMRSPSMRKASMFLWLALTSTGCASAPGHQAPEITAPPECRETRDTTVAIAPAPSDSAQLVTWPDLGDTTLTRLINQLARGTLDVRGPDER